MYKFGQIVKDDNKFKYSAITADDECDFCFRQLKHLHNDKSMIFSDCKNNETIFKCNIACIRYFRHLYSYSGYIKAHRFIFLGMQDEGSIFYCLLKDIDEYFRQLLVRIVTKI